MHAVGCWRRTFTLYRDEDPTGVSGTGDVAEGVRWSDGTVSIRWFGAYSSMVYWSKGLDAVEAVHGHDGRTRVVWDSRDSSGDDD